MLEMMFFPNNKLRGGQQFNNQSSNQ